MIAVSYIKSSLVTDLVNHFTEKKQRRGKVRSPPVTSVPFFLSFSLFFCLDTAKSPSIGLHTCTPLSHVGESLPALSQS